MKTKISIVTLSTVCLAATVSPAFGAEFEAPHGYPPNELEIVNQKAHIFDLASGTRVECEGTEYSSGLSTKSPSLLVSPRYTGCNYFGGGKKIIAAVISECLYEFNNLSGSGPYKGKFSLVSSGKGGCVLLITVPSVPCEVIYKTQGPLKAIEYNVTSPIMEWNVDVTNLTYEVPLACPGLASGIYTTGAYTALFRDEKVLIH